jgi:hypothetical protein
MNSFHEQEQRAGREVEMARARGERKEKVYSLGHVILVCVVNPDYRYNSSPGWSRQPGLKV